MIFVNMLQQITYNLKMHIVLHELRYFYCTEIFLLSAYLGSVFNSKLCITEWVADCISRSGTASLRTSSQSMQWLNVLVNTFRKNGLCTKVQLQDPRNNTQRVKKHSAAALGV